MSERIRFRTVHLHEGVQVGPDTYKLMTLSDNEAFGRTGFESMTLSPSELWVVVVKRIRGTDKRVESWIPHGNIKYAERVGAPGFERADPTIS